jgi:hypothetical protein
MPVKHGHRRRKMPSTQLVHAFKVGVTQQPRVAGKTSAGGWRLDIALRFSRQTGSHRTLNFHALFPVTIATFLSQPVHRSMTIATCVSRYDWQNSGSARPSLRATGLFAETWLYRDPLAPLGATAGNYFLAALGLHAHAKSVYLGSLAPVGLECTLGQSSSLLIPSTVLGQTVSINHSLHYHQTGNRNPITIRTEVAGSRLSNPTGCESSACESCA